MVCQFERLQRPSRKMHCTATCCALHNKATIPAVQDCDAEEHAEREGKTTTHMHTHAHATTIGPAMGFVCSIPTCNAAMSARHALHERHTGITTKLQDKTCRVNDDVGANAYASSLQKKNLPRGNEPACTHTLKQWKQRGKRRRTHTTRGTLVVCARYAHKTQVFLEISSTPRHPWPSLIHSRKS